MEEGARADRQGESGAAQERQGPVETSVGHGQNREHVRPPVFTNLKFDFCSTVLLLSGKVD